MKTRHIIFFAVLCMVLIGCLVFLAMSGEYQPKYVVLAGIGIFGLIGIGLSMTDYS